MDPTSAETEDTMNQTQSQYDDWCENDGDCMVGYVCGAGNICITASPSAPEETHDVAARNLQHHANRWNNVTMICHACGLALYKDGNIANNACKVCEKPLTDSQKHAAANRPKPEEQTDARESQRPEDYESTIPPFSTLPTWLTRAPVNKWTLRAERRRGHVMRTIMTAAALFLALTTTTHASPADCADNGRTGEGFPQVLCPDGSTWYQDLDGQLYTNDAGYPTYCPGVWIEVK